MIGFPIDASATGITDGIRITALEGTTSQYVQVTLITGVANAHVGQLPFSDGVLSYDYTSAGFEADLVIFGSNLAGFPTADSALSLGAAKNNGASVSQGALCLYADGDVSTSAANSYISDQYSLLQYLTSFGWGMSVSDFDAQGFTATLSANAFTDVAVFLLLKFDDPSDAWVDVIDTPATTGTQAVTGLGFKPSSVLLMPTHNTALDTVKLGAAVAVGMDDGTTSLATDFIAENNVSTSRTNGTIAKLSDSVVVRSSGDATEAVLASVSSLDSDGFTLDYTAATVTPRKMLAIALGSSAPTLHYAVYLATAGTGESWDRVTGWSGTPVVSGSEDARTTTGDQVWATLAETLDPGTEHRIVFVWDGPTGRTLPRWSDPFSTLSAAVIGTLLSYHNGTSWVQGELKKHDGAQWVGARLKKFNGSTWEEVDG
jgi:hypothetical protein